ncbi:hypothetical protein DFH06DRAFT_1160262, partial [Mycena polygramma]
LFMWPPAATAALSPACTLSLAMSASAVGTKEKGIGGVYLRRSSWAGGGWRMELVAALVVQAQAGASSRVGSWWKLQLGARGV